MALVAQSVERWTLDVEVLVLKHSNVSSDAKLVYVVCLLIIYRVVLQRKNMFSIDTVYL